MPAWKGILNIGYFSQETRKDPMPFTIQENQIITTQELEDYLKDHGVLSPKRTIRKLIQAGMNIRVGKLILGSDLLAALNKESNGDGDSAGAKS
jgi:hypothetical protein